MSRQLLLLNGLATFGVILFHAEGWAFTAMFAWAHRYDPATLFLAPALRPASYALLRGLEQLVVFSIPAFLFVTGYFVAFSAGRNRAGINPKLVLVRIRHLAIPYALWSALIWVSFALEGRLLGVADYARLLLTGATNPAYYYVPLVIQYYLLSPLIVRLAKRHWRPLLLATGLLQIFVHALQYPDLLGLNVPAAQAAVAWLPKWLFTYRLFWFCLGVVAGFHLSGLKQALGRFKWVALGGVAVCFVVGVVEWEALVRASGNPGLGMRETVVDMFYAGACIAAFLAFSEWRWPQAQHLSTLGTKSYGIYLVHSPVMELVARVIYHAAPWVLAYPPVVLGVVAVLGLGIPLLLMRLVLWSPARRLYVYQFG